MGRFAQDAPAVQPGALVVPGQAAIPGPELARRAARLAAALAESGLRSPDRVAIATTEAPAFFVAFAACLTSGYPAVVIDPLAAGDEIRRMLERSGPRAAIVDETVAGAVTAAGGALSSTTILIGTPAGVGRTGWRPWRPRPQPAGGRQFEAVIEGTADLRWAAVDDAAPAYVMFTSGTTSMPKGVVISRRALFRHVQTLADVFAYGVEATLLHYLPFHHTDGLVHGPAAALLTGMRIVRPGAFSADTAATLPETLREQRITHFLAVPTMLAVVVRSFGDRSDLFATGHFRHAVSTAGYLHDELWQRFETTFGVRLSNFYGMTETVSGSLYCGPGDTSYRRDTLGRPVDCRVRIVADDGTEAPEGTIGRLEIAGEHLMDGYLDDPATTAAVLRDGWLDTGDLFRVDGGFYRFAGRRKTVIKRGGITIHPEDIRRALEALSWIREVEVIGVADPIFEQIVVVCAVLDAGHTAADVHAECGRRLAPERRPDRVLVMADLPRGPSGKVQREALLERVTHLPVAVDLGPSILDQVRTEAGRIFQVDVETLGEATSPEDVPNWDSYAQIELAMALERRFGLRFTPKELMQMRSLGHIVAVVSRRRPGPQP
jgi:long-chain acyl-CoA synthetase